MRTRARIDAVQPEIVAAFRAHGCDVLHTHQLGKGAPDLFLAIPKWHGQIFLFHGMFLELKKEDAPKPKSEQLGYADLLRRQGYNAVIAWGFDEAVTAIKGYLEA